MAIELPTSGAPIGCVVVLFAFDYTITGVVIGEITTSILCFRIARSGP